MVNRGSEVYAYDTAGRARAALAAGRERCREGPALDERGRRCGTGSPPTTESRSASSRPPQPAQDRPDPEPEWADPPKARIGELLAAVDERLRPLPGGIGAVIDMADAMAAEAAGLPRRPHHQRRQARRDRAHRQVRLDRLPDAPAGARARDPAGRDPDRRRRVRPDRGLRGQRLPHGHRAWPRARRSCRSGASRTVCRTASSTWAAAPAEFVGSSTAGRPAGARRPCPAPPPPRRPAEPSRRRRVGGRAQRVRRGGEASLETLFALGERLHGGSRLGRRGAPQRPPRARTSPASSTARGRVEDLVVIADWAASEIEVAGRAAASWEWHGPREHPPARPPARSASSARCAASIPTAARGGSTPSGS